MTLDQLECFLKLAECRNFTKASEELFVSQPAFSKRISTLETEIGVKLFERGSRNAKLTEPGKVYLAAVRESFDILQNGAERARDAEKGLLGYIRLGVLRDGREDILISALKKYRLKYPDVDFEIIQMHHRGLEEALMNDDIDMAFFNSQSEEVLSKSRTLALERTPQCIVVNNEHRLAGRKRVSVRELKEEKFILLDSKISPYCSKLMKLCAKEHFKPKIAKFCNLMTETLNDIECGKGIGFCSQRVSKIASPILNFIEVEEGEMIQHLAIWKYENNNQWIPSFVYMLKAEVDNEKMSATL